MCWLQHEVRTTAMTNRLKRTGDESVHSSLRDHGSSGESHHKSRPRSTEEPHAEVVQSSLKKQSRQSAQQSVRRSSFLVTPGSPVLGLSCEALSTFKRLSLVDTLIAQSRISRVLPTVRRNCAIWLDRCTCEDVSHEMT